MCDKEEFPYIPEWLICYAQSKLGSAVCSYLASVVCSVSPQVYFAYCYVSLFSSVQVRPLPSVSDINCLTSIQHAR